MSYLMEMAYDRKEIQMEFKHQFNNILTNWCLLKYISLTDDKKELRNHWKMELFNAIESVQSMSLTKGNNRKTVQKALLEFYYTKAEYDKKNLAPIVELKFEIENIAFDVFELCEQFKEEIFNIIHLIAFDDVNKIKSYVNGI